jgi:adenylate cyclase
MTKSSHRLRKLKFLLRNWQIPLRFVLVIPFVVQIFAAVGLTGWLSLQNGQQAVNDLATQLREEISARIEQRLHDYLKAPRAINQVNANAIGLGQLNLQNTASLTRQFWFQRDLFKPIIVSAIYFGGADGEFIGLGFQNNNTWQIGRAGQSTGGKFYSYAIDNQGNPGKLLEQGNPYDPRIRPWYENAIQAGQPTWSDIYVDFKDPRLKITLVQPIYDNQKQLKGVLGVDFVLSHIRSFLSTLKIGKSGQTFIIERSGLLVATSTEQQPFTIEGQKIDRLKAVDVEHSLIQNTAKFLSKKFQQFEKITTTQHLNFEMNGKKQFVQVVPFSDGENLDWLIVVVVPEDDFMERIHINTRTTLQLCLLALFIAMIVGLITARWITQPIMRLSQASIAIAKGDFARTVPINRKDELGILARSFNQMSAKLKASHEKLAEYSRSLEQKVNDRTKELLLEKEKSEKLLLNVLPEAIAVRLKQDQSAIADYFEEVTILFADIVGFTPLSARIPPIELVNLLNQVFSRFDQLVEQYNLEKIKTIGDAYMVVGGLPVHRNDHAQAIAEMALEMQAMMQQFQFLFNERFQIRVGIHTGPVVAGVIGTKKFIYDLWGDTVNVASRMESTGIPGKIQVTADTYEKLKEQFLFEKRGLIRVKGKGEMRTYWLIGKLGKR